jgi:hypothetical protein
MSNFKNLGDGYVSLHPEKNLAIKADNYPILHEIQLTVKDGDDYFKWDGKAKGDKLDKTPLSLGKGVGAVLPASDSPEYRSVLTQLQEVKLALTLPQRMFNARRARALVIKTLKSPAMKVKDSAQAQGIKSYMHREDDKAEFDKVVDANLNGTGNSVVVDRPNMF